MDPLGPEAPALFTTKHIQIKNRFTVNSNNASNALVELPKMPTAAHGDFLYNKTLAPNS